MESKSNRILLLVVASLVFVAGYMTGNITKTPSVHAQTIVSNTIPRSWGTLKAVSGTQANTFLFFEGSDGTVRIADIQGRPQITISRDQR
jgi:hypothetical protein